MIKKKYRIYGIIDASKYLGEIEANSKEEAENLAWDDENIIDEMYVGLCHQCAREVEIGDVQSLMVIEDD